MQELNITELLAVSGGATNGNDKNTVSDPKDCTAQNVGAGNIAQCTADTSQGVPYPKKGGGTPAPADKPGPK